MTYLSYINRTSNEQSGMLFHPGLQGVMNRPQQIAAFQGKSYAPTPVETYHMEKNQNSPVITGTRRKILGLLLSTVLITVAALMAYPFL